MLLLEWFVGILIGWWGSRTGVVSIFSILLLLPFLPWSFHAWLVIGLASSLLAFSSSSPFRSLNSLMGLIGGVLGVFFYSQIYSSLPPLEGMVPWLMVGMVGMIIFFSPYPTLKLVSGLLLSLALGYLVLVRWVVPIGVSAILMGLSRFRPLANQPSVEYSIGSCARDAGIGVAAGLLPGVGPGLIGLVGRHFSPALGISNLVFSLGLVSLSQNVRSAHAATLAFHSMPVWTEVIFWLLLGVFLSSVLDTLLPYSWESPPFLQVGVHLSILAWAGGWIGLGGGILAWSLARFFSARGIPSELGLVFLIPPLWLFYS